MWREAGDVISFSRRTVELVYVYVTDKLRFNT
jgi:hypothetical protein